MLGTKSRKTYVDGVWGGALEVFSVADYWVVNDSHLVIKANSFLLTPLCLFSHKMPGIALEPCRASSTHQQEGLYQAWPLDLGLPILQKGKQTSCFFLHNLLNLRLWVVTAQNGPRHLTELRSAIGVNRDLSLACRKLQDRIHKNSGGKNPQWDHQHF